MKFLFSCCCCILVQFDWHVHLFCRGAFIKRPSECVRHRAGRWWHRWAPTLKDASQRHSDERERWYHCSWTLQLSLEQTCCFLNMHQSHILMMSRLRPIRPHLFKQNSNIAVFQVSCVIFGGCLFQLDGQLGREWSEPEIAVFCVADVND